VKTPCTRTCSQRQGVSYGARNPSVDGISRIRLSVSELRQSNHSSSLIVVSLELARILLLTLLLVSPPLNHRPQPHLFPPPNSTMEEFSMLAATGHETLHHPTIGRIRGMRRSPEVDQYLGIQYATLKDRFSRGELPQYDPSDTDGALNATKFGYESQY